MLLFNEDMQSRAEESYIAYRKSSPANALMYDVFLKEFLNYTTNKNKIQYPYTVKIPKPIKSLIAGDFSPAYEIEVTSPIMYKDMEIWTGNCSEKVELHLGYLNGDKRYFSEYSLDAKDKPHGFLGGSTGSGKSVTANQLLFNIFFQYAPWEIEVSLSDAKIVEFKPYGLLHHIPHIHNISATEDGSYLISVLNNFRDEMKLIGNAFTLANGAKNLKEFREATGLCLPRHLLFMDEATAMFKGLSSDQSNTVMKILDDIGALGRAAGYNIILASQQVDDKVSQFITHMPVRMCLRCNSTKVSERILGNDQGAVGDVGMGKIYVNNDIASGSKDNNTKFRVPLQLPSMFSEQGKALEEAGIKSGYKWSVSFYDEQDKIMEDRMMKLCESKSNYLNLVLGEPSFMSKTPDRFEIELTNDDISNILVYAPLNKDLHRYLRTMYCNAIYDKKIVCGLEHRFMVADKTLLSAGSDFELTDLEPEKDGFKFFTLRGTDDEVWKVLVLQIYGKSLVVDADEQAFKFMKYDNESLEIYKELYGKYPETEITKSRAFNIWKLLDSTSYSTNLGMKNLVGVARESKKKQLFKLAFTIIKSLGSNFVNTKIETNSYPSVVMHIVGANKVTGLGRDATMSQTTIIKKLLIDSCRANTFFVIYASDIELLGDTIPGFKYCISDKIKNPSKIKCSEYPAIVRDVCGVFTTIVGNEVKMFKRLSLGISD